MPYVIVFLGAGIGGAARHAVNTAAARMMGYGFPWGYADSQRPRLHRHGSLD